MEKLGDGQKLAILAGKKRLKQKEIAIKLGITEQSVSFVFKSKKLKMNTIQQYCEAIGFSIEDFLLISETTSISQENKIKEDNIKENSGYDITKVLAKLSIENSYLWKIINDNGLKVDTSQLNFNSGVLYSAFAV